MQAPDLEIGGWARRLEASWEKMLPAKLRIATYTNIFYLNVDSGPLAMGKREGVV